MQRTTIKMYWSGFTKSRWKIFVGLATIFLVTAIVYNIQIVHSIGYISYAPIELGLKQISFGLTTLICATFFVPVAIVLPSDFFRLFYSFLVVSFFGTFHASAHELSFAEYVGFLAILIMPLLFLKLLSFVKLRFNMRTIFRIETVQWVVILLCSAVAVISLLNSTASAGFSMETIYVRRLEGRQVYTDSSFLSYLNNMAINGLVPFLAFRAGLRKNFGLLIYCVAFDVLFFYTLGLKGPILLTLLGYVAGRGVHKNDLQFMHKMIFWATVVLFFVFVLEIFVFDYSLASLLFFRRTFIVPTYVVIEYFDVMFGAIEVGWSAVDGIVTEKGISYLVGVTQFDNPDTNVNTNAFVNALATGGFVYYIVMIILVTGLLTLLDALYQSTNNQAYTFLGFSFGILVVQQAATTAFISSGVGLLLMLISLTGNGNHNYREKPMRPIRALN